MRRFIAALLLAAAALSAGPASAHTGPTSVTILRLGDSRTLGVGSSWGTGYAPELVRLLGREGVTATMLPDVAGTGWCVQSLRSTVDAAMAAGPDVAILAIGTNNASGRTVAPCAGMAGFEDAYLDLVRRILADSPTVRLLIAEIQYSSAPWAQQEVHTNVSAIHASWMAECAGRCTLVDLSGISRCGGLGPDGVHPSDAGYQQMGNELARGVLAAFGAPPWPSYIEQGGPRPGYDVPAVRAGNGC